MTLPASPSVLIPPQLQETAATALLFPTSYPYRHTHTYIYILMVRAASVAAVIVLKPKSYFLRLDAVDREVEVEDGYRPIYYPTA